MTLTMEPCDRPVLTESDKQRLEAIMQRVKERRLLRNSPPPRDEAKIASIIKRWEDNAAEERLILDGRSVGNKPQAPTSRSGNLKKFTAMAALKRRFRSES